MTSPASLTIALGGATAAVVGRRRGTLVLEYAPEYLAAHNAVPLSLSLPLTRPRHTGVVVERYLDNLLPDNSGVRDAWARRAQLASADPLSLLGAYGADVAGAFTFESTQPSQAHEPRTLSTGDVAAILRGLRQDATDWQGAGRHGRFSLAGAQAKTSLAYQGGGMGWSETSGAMPSTHILKVAMPGHPDSDLVEHITMFGAGRAGIATAQTHVGRFDDERCLVVSRFDRSIEAAGQTLRLHQEDLVQAMGLSRFAKFQADGGPRPEDILDLLDSNSLRWAAEAAKTDYLRQLAYHWFVGNTDAHAKNFSLWILPGRHLLTPMYDVVSFLPYLTARHGGLAAAMDQLELAANIATSYRTVDAGSFEWQALARKARVPGFDLLAWMRGALPIAAQEIVAEAQRVLADFESPHVESLAERIEVRSTRLLALLD